MPVQLSIGKIIYDARISRKMTQDEFGMQYEVSGPAIFKFEKNYVRPSLGLWLRLAHDAGLAEKQAVLIWLRAKLPEPYRHYLEIHPKGAPVKKSKSGKIDYLDIQDREDLRKAVEGDKKLPKALRDTLLDAAVWDTFKPVGAEIQIVRDLFSPLGKGTPHAYIEALWIVREFTHSF